MEKCQFLWVTTAEVEEMLSKLEIEESLKEYLEYLEKQSTMNRLIEKWSKKYKKSINCDNPRVFHRKRTVMVEKERILSIEEIIILLTKRLKSLLMRDVRRDIRPIQRKTKNIAEKPANCVKAEEGKDPAKGTGKKPKGSGRRLYTDEDPSDTVAVKLAPCLISRYIF